MNTTHRSIWNAALGTWVAVSEITRARGKRSGSVVALAVGIACSSVGAQTIIDNGDVVTVPGTHGSPWNLGGSDLLINNGTLTVESGGQVSTISGYMGNFSGTGNATVTGVGSTWTNLQSLFVGYDGNGTLTVANGGHVSINNGFSRLDVAVATGTTGVLNIGGAVGSAAQAAGTVAASLLYLGAGTSSLNFNHTDAAYVFATPITGLGVVNQVAGTTILTGANTYTGGTTVSGGTLQGNSTSLQGNITNNAAVTFDQTSAGTYAGVMSGNGVFNKTGSGNMSLTGTNTYTGATSVNAGTLSVNGAIASPVTVNSGGALGGSGTINGAVNISAGGAFVPGNSIGTITVNGNVNFAPGSIYRVEVDAAGNADRINVVGAPGTATLNGTVDVQAGAGSYQANTQYTILNATGGLTGNFSGVTSNLAFLTPSLSYGLNNVFLSLARNDVSYASVATTPNQQASAAALQAVATGATGDLATVVNTLTGLSAPQARAAYDAIGGASLVALRRAGAAFAGGFGQQLNRRLGVVAPGDGTRQAFTFGSPLLLAANDWQVDGQHVSQHGMGAALDSAQRIDQRGIWLRGYGAGSNTDSDGNAAADTLRSSGMSAGLDAEVSDGLVLGAALTSGTSRVTQNNSADSGRSRGNALGVYGSYASGPWAFRGSASLAWNANHMDRAVAVGPLVRTASSDFASRSQSLYGEATYDMPRAGYLLQPMAALSYVRTRTSGFIETGAGALNLQVAQQTTTSTRTLLGAKTVHEMGNLRIEPRLLWAHEFGNVNEPLAASLTGAPAAGSFQVSGVALKRDSLVLGLGVSGQLRKGLTLVADAQLEGNTRQRNLAFFVGLRGVW